MIDKNFTPERKQFFQTINSELEEKLFCSKETYVHPSSIIGPNVTLEENVKVGPFCIIIGNTKIGCNTRIFSHASIGIPANDTSAQKNLGSIEIGKNCEIKEFVNIHSSKKIGGKTKIGNNCYLMNFTHFAHDVILEDNVTIINNVNLAGHVHIEKNVMVMANCALHQFCKIGKFSCLTPFSGTRQDIPPFCSLTGQPARFSGLNLIALKRAGFLKKDIDSLKHVTKLFFQDKILLNNIIKLAKDNLDDWGGNKHVLEFIEFIKNSERGVSRRVFCYKENIK